MIFMENIILSFQDVTVTRSGNELILANSRIRRVLDLACGAPRTVSLTDAQGKEYADATKTSPDLAFIAMYPAGMNEAIPWHITDISAEAVPASFRDSAHVKVSISMREEVSETEEDEKQSERYESDPSPVPVLPLRSIPSFCECPVIRAVRVNASSLHAGFPRSVSLDRAELWSSIVFPHIAIPSACKAQTQKKLT